MFIPDPGFEFFSIPDHDFLSIPDLGVKKARDPGSATLLRCELVPILVDIPGEKMKNEGTFMFGVLHSC
jgi:hypothetical protein